MVYAVLKNSCLTCYFQVISLAFKCWHQNTDGGGKTNLGAVSWGGGAKIVLTLLSHVFRFSFYKVTKPYIFDTCNSFESTWLFGGGKGGVKFLYLPSWGGGGGGVKTFWGYPMGGGGQKLLAFPWYFASPPQEIINENSFILLHFSGFIYSFTYSKEEKVRKNGV